VACLGAAPAHLPSVTALPGLVGVSSGTLLRDGRTLVLPARTSGVFCFNMSVGSAGDAVELLWNTPLAGDIQHEVGVDEARGRVYAGSHAADMAAIDLATGAVVWTVPVGGSVEESSPVIDDGGLSGFILSLSFPLSFFLSFFFFFLLLSIQRFFCIPAHPPQLRFVFN
jgi:hypothetical protein